MRRLPKGKMTDKRSPLHCSICRSWPASSDSAKNRQRSYLKTRELSTTWTSCPRKEHKRAAYTIGCCWIAGWQGNRNSWRWIACSFWSRHSPAMQHYDRIVRPDDRGRQSPERATRAVLWFPPEIFRGLLVPALVALSHLQNLQKHTTAPVPVRIEDQAYTPSPPAAHQSAAPCRQIAASPNGSPPTAASNNGHASPIARPSSPAFLANSLATSSRSSSAAPVAATGSSGCTRARSAITAPRWSDRTDIDDDQQRKIRRRSSKWKCGPRHSVYRILGTSRCSPSVTFHTIPCFSRRFRRQVECPARLPRARPVTAGAIH